MSVSQIPLVKAHEKFRSGGARFVDIRDARSFAEAHIPGSLNLNDGNVHDFLRDADPAAETIVVCYHGFSSQGATGYLQQHGFTNVHSMMSGFEGWRTAGFEHERAPA